MRSNIIPQEKQHLVWRHIADMVLERQESTVTQQAIADELEVSKALVHHALIPLRGSGAVEVVGKRLVVRDVKKVLLHWAVHRRLDRDIVLALGGEDTPDATVRSCPPGLSFTSFAGYVRRYAEHPAPYAIVRAYIDPNAEALRKELVERFPRPRGPGDPGLVLHAADPALARAKPAIVSAAQLYVDLWNEADFFAMDYLRALDRRLNLA